MQRLASDSQATSHKENRAYGWTPLKGGKEERVEKSAFRILIVDRDSMSSDLLADALVREKKFEAAAMPPAGVLQALATGEFDLVVIGADLHSKPGTGFDLAQAVCGAYPTADIVILLNDITQESVINAFRSGARGVFCRQQSMSEFLDCIEHVKNGFIWAGRREANFLLSAFKNIPAPNLANVTECPALTVREMQVVQCAAKGKTNRAIANELGLSEHTVKNYLFRAFEKLGVSSRVELLFYLTLSGHTLNPPKADTVGDVGLTIS